MGKGDLKTRRGKIVRGTHGVRRKRKNADGKKIPFEPVIPIPVVPKLKTTKSAPKKTTAAKQVVDKVESRPKKKPVPKNK